MTQWVALPTRQPGEAISQLDYRITQSPTGGQHVTMFRHRDNRVWQASIANNPQTVQHIVYPFTVEVTCGGCRPWVFLSLSILQSKQTVSRFANLAIGLYRRLVTDASGTTDFPVPGVVGVFRMRLDTQPGDAEPTEVTGVARYDTGRIIVFPRSQELTAILSTVCASDTVAIVPAGINEIPTDADRGVFMVAQRNQRGRSSMPLQVDDDELSGALSRLYDGTAERVLARLQTGECTTTKHREAREIDFPDEDKTQ